MKKNKLLSAILALAIASTAAADCSWDRNIAVGIEVQEYGELLSSGPCGKQAEYAVYGTAEEKTLVISGSGVMNSYTSNNTPWHNDKSTIYKIIVEPGIETIGNNAFASCNNATSVELPDSVTNIKLNAFYGCKNLKTLKLPANLHTIGASAFTNCNALSTSTVEIPASVTSIGNYAFNYTNANLNCLFNPDITSFEQLTNNKPIVIHVPRNLLNKYQQKLSGYSQLELYGDLDEMYTDLSEFDFQLELNSYEFKYTGDPAELEITVCRNNLTLVEDVDYQVVIPAEEPPTEPDVYEVVVEGIGAYSGELSGEFEILGNSDPIFYVTIPTAVQLGQKMSVTLDTDNSMISFPNELVIYIEGMGGDFKLISEDGESEVRYTIREVQKGASGTVLETIDSLSNGDEIMRTNTDDPDTVAEAELTFNKPENIPYAGHYAGTVTFTVACV